MAESAAPTPPATRTVENLQEELAELMEKFEASTSEGARRDESMLSLMTSSIASIPDFIAAKAGGSRERSATTTRGFPTLVLGGGPGPEASREALPIISLGIDDVPLPLPASRFVVQ